MRLSPFSEKPTIEGKRVTLVPLGRKHADDFFLSSTESEVSRLTGTHAQFTRAQIEQWCSTRADQDDRLDYAVIENESGTFSGELAVLDFDDNNSSCQFRIALNANATGRGLGTEATRLIVNHVFSVGLHRIALEVFDFNPRARRVYEKVGFVYEGTSRDALLWDGKWVDAHNMSVLKSDDRF